MPEVTMPCGCRLTLERPALRSLAARVAAAMRISHGPKPSCTCGTCHKCKNRVRMAAARAKRKEAARA